jgi:Mo-dependent nitrogenase C-terminus
MKLVENTLQHAIATSGVSVTPSESPNFIQSPTHSHPRHFFPLMGLRQKLDGINVKNPHLARLLCRAIPTQCPFARDVRAFGRTLFRIPPICQLNPLYDELIGLRFRALCYLADECGEDVTPYL